MKRFCLLFLSLMCVYICAAAVPGGGGTPGGNTPGGQTPGGQTDPGGQGGVGGTFVYDTCVAEEVVADGAVVDEAQWTGYETGVTAIMVPAGVTAMAAGVCAGNTVVTSVDLSESAITRLSTAAFRGCTRLASIKLPATCTALGEGAFDSFSGTVYYPAAQAAVWTNLLAVAGVTGAAYEPDSAGGETPSTGGDEEDDDPTTAETSAAFTAAYATEFDGYLTDAASNLVGTITVKAAKAATVRSTGLSRSRLTVVVQLAGEKKVTTRGYLDLSQGTWSTTLKTGRVLSLSFTENSLAGTLDAYAITGCVNGFVSKVKETRTAANERLSPLLGTYALVYQDDEGVGLLNVKIAAKGKVTVSGTTSAGTRLSLTCQLLQGDEWSYVPVLYVRKTTLVFGLALKNDGTEFVVDGLANALCGLPGTLASGATFYLDGAVAGVVEVNGRKWTSPLGDDLSALKLTFTAKTGAFKGSFKSVSVVGTKTQTVTYTVTGLVVNGKGYGWATCKHLSSMWTVLVE